jgi:hypothetical protein
LKARNFEIGHCAVHKLNVSLCRRIGGGFQAQVARPNIIGTVRDMYGSSGRYVSDAFKQTEIGVANGLASGSAFSLGSTNIVMYASDSNSLYGSSSTVQPAAGAIQYLIKY